VKYGVEVETRARREFYNLPNDVQARIEEVIDDLQENPRPPGAKPLIGKEGYRIRKGDYRVLYTVDDKSHVVSVYRIGHRRDVYRGL